MQTWKWLYKPALPFNWRFIVSVLVRTVILVVAANLLFVPLAPMPTLGRISAYNLLFEGRDRLPYGENPDASYNLSLFNLNAMFASQKLAGADHAGEYRVLLIGDSSVWGILLRPGETLAGQINRGAYHTADGRRVRAYNLGYPTMSVTKDLMLLDHAMQYDPDLIVWLVTLESFDQTRQLDTALVQHNPDPVRDLIRRYDLDQNPDDARFVDLSVWDRTIIGRRRALADLLRLQYYGAAWAMTGIDQEYGDYIPRMVDLPDDNTWHDYTPPTFTPGDLAFDVLRAGVARAGDVPVLFVNEPIFISDGENSDIRYDFFYPRWAYDDYRNRLHDQAAQQGWPLLDVWDALPDAVCYTDSAVHLTPDCSAQLGQRVGPAIVQMADQSSPSG